MPNEQDNISAIKDFYLPNICKSNKLKVTFKKDAMAEAILNLGMKKEFARRHRRLMGICTILKYAWLMRLLKLLPTPFTTPIIFYITKDRQIRQNGINP